MAVLALGAIGVAAGLATSGRDSDWLALSIPNEPVLLLDEPGTHLDHATADAVMGDLSRCADATVGDHGHHRGNGLTGFDRIIDLVRQTSDPDRVGLRSWPAPQ